LNPPPDVTTVELYLRPTQSKNINFIGLATKSNDRWQFFFDPKNTPSGTYEIYAKARSQNRLVESASQLIIVKSSQNLLPPPVIDQLITEPRALSKPVENVTQKETKPSATTTALIPADTLRSFSDLSVPADIGTEELNQTARNSADSLFVGHRDEINTLLNRYAVAKQSGDQILIELAEQEFSKKRALLIEGLIAQESSVQYINNIDKEIENRLQLLKKRVDTFEELRRTASNETTSLDTDSDGISDFDEINLYATDPNIPDTDNDGFTDGIEILRGFNPLDPSSQATLSYESPKESLSLLQPELLKVESVTPVLATTEFGDTLPVQAEIRGFGLPNSFITLYIFSTPTVVTVKTDSDGSFVYIFEKELEDGKHEVYVAITDNTGSIVAQSNPFRFIKEAQAFTPVAQSVTDLQSPQSFQEFSTINFARTITGMGILALGIILLMLGIGMRERSLSKATQTPA
jgi:hypothetical protein